MRSRTRRHSTPSLRSRRRLLQAPAHDERVPQLAARAPVVLEAQALVDEAVLAVERDRRGVVREDLERELVQTIGARLLDRRGHQQRADAAPAPRTCDAHADLA